MSLTPVSSGYGSGMAAIDALRRMQPPAKGATPVTESTGTLRSGDHVVAVMTACLGSCAMGAGVGYASPALVQLASETGIELNAHSPEARWFTAILPLVAIPGALASSLMLNHLGCRRTLVVSAFGLVCSWFTLMFSSNTMTLYVGRMIGGFYTGVISVCVPLYVTEISPASRRAFLGSSVQVAVGLGILLPYVLCPILRWRWVAGACILPAALLLSFSSHLLDTPDWLSSKGNRADADRVLQRLYGLEFLAEFEFRRLEHEQCVGKVVHRPRIPGRVGLCLSLQLLHQSSWVNVILLCASQILSSAIPDVPSALCAALIAASHPGVTLIFGVLTADIGRRPLLLLSAVLVSGGITGFSTMDTLRQGFLNAKVEGGGGSGWAAAFAVFFVVIGHCLGLGHIPWLLLGEVMPQRVRLIGSATAVAFYWCISFLLVYYNLTVLNAIRFQGAFWAYGLAVLLLAVLVVLFIPETEGRSLVSIDTK